MLRDSRVYVDPDKFNPDRFLAIDGHVPEMDPSEVGVFGFGRRCVNIQSGTRVKFIEVSLLSASAQGNISPNCQLGLV